MRPRQKKIRASVAEERENLQIYMQLVTSSSVYGWMNVLSDYLLNKIGESVKPEVIGGLLKDCAKKLDELDANAEERLKLYERLIRVTLDCPNGRLFRRLPKYVSRPFGLDLWELQEIAAKRALECGWFGFFLDIAKDATKYPNFLVKVQTSYSTYCEKVVRDQLIRENMRAVYFELPKEGFIPPNPKALGKLQKIQKIDEELFRDLTVLEKNYEMVISGIIDIRDIPELAKNSAFGAASRSRRI